MTLGIDEETRTQGLGTLALWRGAVLVVLVTLAALAGPEIVDDAFGARRIARSNSTFTCVCAYSRQPCANPCRTDCVSV